MSDQDELFYQQAIARRTMLGLLRRLCMGQHRDTLLKAICVGSLPKPLNQALAEWNQIVLQDMENLIRQDVGQYGQLVRQAMALLFDHEGQAQRIATILEPLRKAWQRNNSQRIEQLLWNVLSQHFKDKMDQLDGAGGGPGVHQLQVMRRLEPLSRELESQRGKPYVDKAELAADLLALIQARKLSNLPNTIPKIMEYLYALDARFQTSLDDDTQQIPLIDGIIADTETEIQFEQCLEKLKVPLREALFIHHGLDERPAFLREEDFRQHYGFGFETLRKNAATAAKLLSDCLLQ